MVVKSSRIKSGISQTGGKYRLVNRLRELTPYHEFFLSMFTGAAHFELNKPRCRYECWNDGESEIINYLVQIRMHPKEFDAMKQGVFGLVSQEICNRIVNGKIKPKNDLERAYYFYYLNKLTFGGSIWKVRKKPNYALEPGGLGNPLKKGVIEDIKEEFEFKTKGYIGLIDQKQQNARIDAPGIEEAKNIFKEINKKANFRGVVPKASFRGVVLPTVCKEKSVDDAKASYRGKTGIKPSYSLFSAGMGSRDGTMASTAIEKGRKGFKNANAPYAGIHNTRALGASANKRDLDKTKEQFKEINAAYRGISDLRGTHSKRDEHLYKEGSKKERASYKGTNPKTTRPFTNNDCGLLSPIDKEAIKRLRYVNLTAYDFRKVYKMFYEAFYVRKGLERECFVYSDSPYPGTEKYYGDLFKPEYHQDLIDIALATPFNFMLSMGGKCEAYLEQLSDWNIVPVKVKYSTSANHQKDSQEYI
ncbi:hypothetical protein LCGC14_1031160, partial [marine sediment metagenome]